MQSACPGSRPRLKALPSGTVRGILDLVKVIHAVSNAVAYVFIYHRIYLCGGSFVLLGLLTSSP
jgi:hypothetical protein